MPPFMEFAFAQALLSLLFFSLKAVIVVLSVLICVIVPLLVIKKLKIKGSGREKQLKLTDLKSRYEKYTRVFEQKTKDPKEFKKYLKSLKIKKKNKEGKKASLFVLSFTGDIKASQTQSLREEISLILKIARPGDETALLLESPGGGVSHYGLAAAQLERLRHNKIPLTVCVDRMAASGGYMMACVGQPVLASAFAFIGSIGVLFNIPNLHEFLKKRDIGYEELSAGKYKRTVTAFGKITEEKRDRLKKQLELIHRQFKNFVLKYRDIDIEQTATGEAWTAEEALKKGLIDGLKCSDDYLLEKMKTHRVLKISLKSPKSLLEKMLDKNPVSEKLRSLESLPDSPFLI